MTPPMANKETGPVATLISQFRACARGVAAVEFALILPILILILLGTTELTRALTYDRKVSQVASTVADLVAQANTISSGEMTDIFAASQTILQPYSASDLGIVLSSVSFDANGDPKVEGSCGSNATPWATNDLPPITIPDAISLPNSSVIVAVSNYTYRPIFTSIIADTINLGETFFLRPRLVNLINLPC